MRPLEIVQGLTAHERRGAGSDAERRAALWLAERLREGGREVLVETFWCRPNWAAAHAWHAALALAGSLIAVGHPRIGGVLVLVAAVSTALDGLAGVSLGRRLTAERASQNVIALPPLRERSKTVCLILSANYDSGRTAVVHSPLLRRPCASACRTLHGFTPGWLGWLIVAMLWLVGVALARAQGAGGIAVALAQLPPTVGVVVALAALLELAISPCGPGANDNASGVAAALTLARALDAAAPANAAVHVVLTGASDGDGTGMRRYLRARRRSLRPQSAIVVGLAPCGLGRPVWWHSDGPLVPMRHTAALRHMCAALAAQGTEPELRPHRGRGTSPALWARQRGIPSIALGRLGTDGLPARSHRDDDVPDRLDPGALDLSVALTCALVDEIDAHLGRLGVRGVRKPSAPRGERRAGRRRRPRAGSAMARSEQA